MPNAIYIQMGPLRKLLHRVALSEGATVRFGAGVTTIDPVRGNVSLSSGEVLSGDVIVGADGAYGVSRQILLDEADAFESAQAQPSLTLNMYRYERTPSVGSVLQYPFLQCCHSARFHACRRSAKRNV